MRELWRRLLAMGRAIVARVGQSVTDAGLTSALDALECLIGLALITVALWPRFGELALLVPGIVLVWTTLPSRRPFVESDRGEEPPRRT